jgi:hypothetical protein
VFRWDENERAKPETASVQKSEATAMERIRGLLGAVALKRRIVVFHAQVHT